MGKWLHRKLEKEKSPVLQNGETKNGSVKGVDDPVSRVNEDFPGVVVDKRKREGTKRYRASGWYKGKQCFIGLYLTAAEAYKAILDFREKYPTNRVLKKTSKYPGISFSSYRNKWEVNAPADMFDKRISRRDKFVGIFETEAKAIEALRKFSQGICLKCGEKRESEKLARFCDECIKFKQVWVSKDPRRKKSPYYSGIRSGADRIFTSYFSTKEECLQALIDLKKQYNVPSKVSKTVKKKVLENPYPWVKVKVGAKKPYYGRVMSQGEVFYSGYFSTREEAHKALLELREKHPDTRGKKRKKTE